MQNNSKIAALTLTALLGAGTLSAQQVEKSSRAGTSVYEAAFNSSDGHIYVSASGSRTNTASAGIFKINPKTLAIVDSISLSDNPPFGIGINSKTQIAYTTNTRTNSVSAIDLKTGKLISTFNAGGDKSHTREVLVDENKNLIYVTNVGTPSDIWVIDGKTNKVIRTITAGTRSTGIAFNKKSDKVFVTNLASNEVALIDLTSGNIEKTFPSGGEGPINIATDGDRLFVTNQTSGTLTVLDANTGTLIKSIPTGAGAIGVAYDKVKNRIYSANRGTGTTTVIDGKTYAILADLPTGSHPNFVTLDPKTGDAYVVNKTKAQRRQPQAEGAAPAAPQTPPAADTNGDTITKIK